MKGLFPVGHGVIEIHLDVLEEQLIQRNLMLFGIRQDAAFHCGGNQLRSRHFIQHEERNATNTPLSNSQEK